MHRRTELHRNTPLDTRSQLRRRKELRRKAAPVEAVTYLKCHDVEGA